MSSLLLSGRYRRHKNQRDMGTCALESRLIVAAEALLRWNHPDHGVVSPGEFIQMAEKSDYIKIFGAWVMVKACRKIKQWRAAGGLIDRIDVNVSTG
jgi:EAL domain-containing protein (putative c-di-GMP-specific phosphodiesterase class I)